MHPVVATVGAVLLVPVLGALLGALQLAYYRARVRAGRMKEDEIPFFGALLLRGMVAVFAVIALIGIAVNVAAPR